MCPAGAYCSGRALVQEGRAEEEKGIAQAVERVWSQGLLLPGSIPKAPHWVRSGARLQSAHVRKEFGMLSLDQWRFFTDQVMGGVSSGSVVPLQENGRDFLRMTGKVSTANRGGFIQMRHDLGRAPPETTMGIRLIARGNGQRYFVHLRSTDAVLPWQFHQAGFDVTQDWSEVSLSLDAFAPLGRVTPLVPQAAHLTSVAIAAYGRDHLAAIDLCEIGFF